MFAGGGVFKRHGGVQEVTMKVVITSAGEKLGDKVDLRFGRAQYFIVMDTETGQHEVVNNEQNLNAAQGAGIQAGKNVVDTGAAAVITGNVGPNAHNTLQAAQVKIYLCPNESCTVQQAFDLFNKGELQSADQANVTGHWM